MSYLYCWSTPATGRVSGEKVRSLVSIGSSWRRGSGASVEAEAAGADDDGVAAGDKAGDEVGDVVGDVVGAAAALWRPGMAGASTAMPPAGKPLRSEAEGVVGVPGPGSTPPSSGRPSVGEEDVEDVHEVGEDVEVVDDWFDKAVNEETDEPVEEPDDQAPDETSGSKADD